VSERTLDELIETQDNLLESAWGIIANAGYGNWEVETSEWQEAAARWRERYFDHLGRPLDGPAEEKTP